MVDDLKIIKKNYGEDMMHYCRDNFSTILEVNGALSQIMLDNFYPNKKLYNDIVEDDYDNDHLSDFKNYIYNVFDENHRETIYTDKYPYELMKRIGYTLYECKTEEDIQRFKKYYAKGEELCTFKGNRLNRCYVFFAVKDNVDEIKRENFKNPQREDEYGTSVISIQFTKDNYHRLSIKNRYNHKVYNPDATYENNLDNITEGLTNSFEKYYGMKQKFKEDEFFIPSYIRANDNKFYKFNLEQHAIYYCKDNIIIDNYNAHKFPKEKYIVMNYFILDLVNKKMELYDKNIYDSFIELFYNIENINIYNDKVNKTKMIKIKTSDCGTSYIVLNKNNEIIKFANDTIDFIGNNFLLRNESIKEVYLPNVEVIGDNFMLSTYDLQTLYLPSVKYVGNDFMEENFLEKIYLPKLESVGYCFLKNSHSLEKICLPNLKYTSREFMRGTSELQIAIFPNLKEFGDYALMGCMFLEYLYTPNLEEYGDELLEYNQIINKGDIYTIVQDNKAKRLKK